MNMFVMKRFLAKTIHQLSKLITSHTMKKARKCNVKFGKIR